MNDIIGISLLQEIYRRDRSSMIQSDITIHSSTLIDYNDPEDVYIDHDPTIYGAKRGSEGGYESWMEESSSAMMSDGMDTAQLEEAIVETLIEMKDITYDCLDIQVMEYHNKFEAEYLRNNKSKTVKNIRCFPSCCQNGMTHIKSGFCGSSIRNTMVLKG